MFRTRIVRSVHDFDRIRSRWQQLLAPGHSIFQTFAWSRLAVGIFAATAVPYIVLAESDSGTAIIPAVLAGAGTYIGLLGEALFDYRDVLADGDPSVFRRAWAEVATLNLPLSFYALRGEAAQQRWSEFEPQPFCNALYSSPAEVRAAEFCARHSRLASRSRRLARKGIELRQYDGSDTQLLKTIYERKSQQPTPGGNLFLDPLRREFMQRIAAANPAACEIFTFERAGGLVAALVAFRHRNTRHFYTTYFDARWADLSPGQLLVYEITARSLAEGLTCDFMTGEYPFKARVATGAVPLYRVEASAEMLSAIAEGRIESQQLAA